MWIIRCKSQSRTYSSNYFVLLWPEEVAFYLKCFQKRLCSTMVYPVLSWQDFALSGPLGEFFSGLFSTSQATQFPRLSQSLWEWQFWCGSQCLQERRGTGEGVEFVQKPRVLKCSEYSLFASGRACLHCWGSQPKHSVSQLTEARLSRKANSLHPPTFRAHCLQRDWSPSPSLAFAISLCGLRRADASMKLN